MNASCITGIAAALLAGMFNTVCAADNVPPVKLVLGVDECIRMALKSAPELGEAQADIDLTSSKLAEARSYRYPQVDVMSLFGPAPQARKEDLLKTDKAFSFNEMTWFGSADATIIQPLYTFGKISENMTAATHGIEVDRSRKEQRANEIALKVREYYYGLMLAREMKELVLEVQESLLKAREKAQKLLEQGSESVEEMDIYKLDAFSGEARKYLEEATKGERLALSALKTRLGIAQDAQMDIASERLMIVDVVIPEFEAFVDKARLHRPEYRQIQEGLKARNALVEAAKANYYPDIFLGGLFSWAYADGRDRIRNPYINDQFKHMNGGVALGVRWKLDFGITGAKVAAEQAQYQRLLSTREYAEANIPLQIKKFYLELKEAENSAKATNSAYTNAKKWAVTALANFDFGIGPAKEIFEALQAYARMRAAYFQSLYNYRIAWANLEYATGEPPLESSQSTLSDKPETAAHQEFETVKGLSGNSRIVPANVAIEAASVTKIRNNLQETDIPRPISGIRSPRISIPIAQTAKGRVAVTEIIVEDQYVEIVTNAKPATIKQTRLSAPERFAIDVPGAKCLVTPQATSVQRSGIEKIRIGCHPDHVRIVLDVTSEKIPPYDVVATARGLRIATVPTLLSKR